MDSRLFIYGSLRSGESHGHLLATSRREGMARTAQGYRLLDLGAYPGLVQGGTTAVVGEVVWVSATTLALLDAYEGHPELFERRPISLADASAAQTYFLVDTTTERCEVVAHGDWCQRHTTRKGVP